MQPKALLLMALLLTLVEMACRKNGGLEPGQADDPECHTLPLVITPSFFTENQSYRWPVINPNSPNEFIYQYVDWHNQVFQVIKYDMQAETSTVLIDNFPSWDQPSWSRKGWIACTKRGVSVVEHIYIVKENGDSLMQFSTNLHNYSPAWDSSGDHLYWRHSQVLANPHYYVRKSIHGGDVDTIFRAEDANLGVVKRGVVTQGNILIASTLFHGAWGLGYSNLASENPEFTNVSVPANFSSSSIHTIATTQFESDVYITLYSKGLYKVNIYTGEVELLMNFCPSKRYDTISCSPDGTFLIGQRVDVRYGDETDGPLEGKIIEKPRIFRIDLPSMEETFINLEM